MNKKKANRGKNKNTATAVRKYSYCPYCAIFMKTSRLNHHMNRLCPNRHKQAPRFSDPKTEPQERTRVLPKAVRDLQKRAEAAGRKWIVVICYRCKEEVQVRVNWINPLILCKSCRAKRQIGRRTGLREKFSAKTVRLRDSLIKRYHKLKEQFPELVPELSRSQLDALVIKQQIACELKKRQQRRQRIKEKGKKRRRNHRDRIAKTSSKRTSTSTSHSVHTVQGGGVSPR